jgi:alpha-tubulin suppressor-like RCC1 family protein
LTLLLALMMLIASLLGMAPSPALANVEPSTVYGWGYSVTGQTTPPAGLNDAIAVGGGSVHSIALRSNGTVVAWGTYNNFGQASVPADLTGVTAISAGYFHNLALKSDGTVVGWGDNQYGQATAPDGLSGVIAIAGSWVHSMALKNDGTVVAWGGNFVGQRNVPAGLSGVTAIAAGGSHSLALKSDGTVVAWGYNNLGQSTPPAGLSGVIAIAGGGYHSLALQSDGTVVAWGSNEEGQSTVPAGLSGVVAIAAGAYHSLALKSDGTVVAWGSNGFGQSTVPTGLSNVRAISSNVHHNLMLLGGPDGAAPTANPSILPSANAAGWNSTEATVNWNWSDTGGSGINSANCTTTSVVSSDGQQTLNASCADLAGNVGSATYTVKLDRTAPVVTITGVTNRANYPVDGAPAAACSTTDALSGVANQALPTVSGNSASGTGLFVVRCSGATDFAGNSGSAGAGYMIDPTPGMAAGWGSNAAGQLASLAERGPVIAGSASGNHSLALKPDRTVLAWGSNSSGESNVPAGLSDVIAIAAGSFHSLALKRDGTVVAWSSNSAGQSSVPAGLNDVIAIAAGWQNSLVLKSDGTIVGWGLNNYGQSTAPAGLTDVVAIDAGYEHSLALKRDGTVRAWGRSDFGQITVPAGLSNVIAIAAGDYHSMALKSDGTVVAWGGNYKGQSTVPGGLSNVVAISAGGDQSVALKRDGTLAAWGANYYNEGTVPAGISNVVAISAGAFHNLLIREAITVTVNQAAVQADPTDSNPVRFDAVFSEPVTGFSASDVTLSGTADRTGATVTISGGPAAYTITIDGLAGNGTVIASLAANVAATADGRANFASTSMDNSVTVNLDSTPPVITPGVVGPLGSNGWYTSDVTVSWTVTDNESAISEQSGCTAQYVTSDTSGVTFTCSATSAGGSSSQSVTIKRDATAPTITFANRTAPNAAGWSNSAVTVSWTCSDATSGAVSTAASRSINAEGAGQSATGTCADKAGNSASNTQTGINIDATAPTISAAATSSPNANGWYRGNVTVAFSCADALSDIAAGACPASQVLTAEGTSVSSAARTVTDRAGNTSAPSGVVTVKIDKAVPVVSVTGVTDGAIYVIGTAPIADCSTSDALSGVATEATISLTGSGVGSYTATCAGATDRAGNAAPAVSVSYRVAYTFVGFFAPVDNLPTVNTANAGRTIPLKWRVTDAAGNPVTSLTSVTLTSVASGCSASAPSDTLEEYASTTSGLQNQGNGYYQFNWQTERSWSGCRTLRLDLGDGVLRTALFQFR